jgi:hypothetical protein
MVILVAIAVATVFVTRTSAHTPTAVNPSVDACRIVTSADATAIFGDNAGPPHTVLNACVYDDGTHELIVSVARTLAKPQFDASRGPAAKPVPGVGDAAYYLNGELWVLKGTNLLQLTLGPVPAPAPNPKVIALANTALARLALPTK